MIFLQKFFLFLKYLLKNKVPGGVGNPFFLTPFNYFFRDFFAKIFFIFWRFLFLVGCVVASPPGSPPVKPLR